MGIITKRNGKILMILGVLLIVIGIFGGTMTPRSIYEQAEQTGIYPWYTIILSFMVLLGPFIAVVGIPVFVIGAKRVPSKLMDILKSSPHMRTRIKISFLAQQLGINEKDVVSTVSKLRSNGEPVSIDDSTLEVIYNPILSPPTTPLPPMRARAEMEAKPVEKPVFTPVPPPARAQRAQYYKGRCKDSAIWGTLLAFMALLTYYLGNILKFDGYIGYVFVGAFLGGIYFFLDSLYSGFRARA